MPKTFDYIAIIYNPESTGDAPRLAEQLAKNLANEGFSADINHTKRPKHAISIAERISLKYKRPLIISVSGDGGYNEVINGAMNAKRKSEKAQPVVSVLGAGNANDHYRVMHDSSIVELVKTHSVKPMDLISFHAKSKKTIVERYAHSYIGFGITPEVGDQLNRHGKGLLSELVLILKTFKNFEPFEIIHDKQSRLCDSLIFANINEMAKVVKLDATNTVDDDKFEVIEIAHKSKFRLLLSMVRAAILGFTKPPSYSSYTFQIPKKLAVQSDGEISELPAHSSVTITSHGDAIDSLY